RAHLYRSQNQFEKLINEFQAAYKTLAQTKSPREAAQRVFLEVAEQRLPQDQPLIALKIVAKLPLSSSPSAWDAETLQQKRDLVASALASLRVHPQPGSAAVLLENAELCDEEYLISAASLALDRTATNNDAAALVRAIESESVAKRLISIPAVARL